MEKGLKKSSGDDNETVRNVIDEAFVHKICITIEIEKTISSDKIRLECTQQGMTFSLLTLTKATLKLAINYIP